MARLLRRAATAAVRNSPWCAFYSAAVDAAALPTIATPASSPASRLLTPSDERLLRLLRSELEYLARRCRPRQPALRFKSFAVEDRPGEQWARLTASRSAAGEVVKIDASMFDGHSPMPGPDATLFERVEALERGSRLNLALLVEVSRAGRTGDGPAVQFFCSAWPDSIVVQRVLMLPRSSAGDDRPTTGRKFKDLSEGVRGSLMRYLAEREVDGELAEFLHEFMKNKENTELFQWLKTVESYVDEH